MPMDPKGNKNEPLMVPPPPSMSVPVADPTSLPEGWSAAVAPDGRIYYFEQSTGTSSWTHPLAPKPPPPPMDHVISPTMSSKSGILAARSMKSQPSMTEHDNPFNASRHPDSHQCYAVIAVILFFPIGLCALIQSFNVDQAWGESRFGDAVNHSRQALLYARFSCALGAIFWIYWIFFSGPGGFEFVWPRFDF